MKKKIIWVVLALTVLAISYIAMPKVKHVETDDTVPESQDHELNSSADIDAESPTSENISLPAESEVASDTVQHKDIIKTRPGATPVQP